MSVSTKYPQTAPQAYTEHANAIKELLDRVGSFINGAQDCRKVNWSQVGDLASIRERLQDVSDSIYNKGEYAK